MRKIVHATLVMLAFTTHVINANLGLTEERQNSQQENSYAQVVLLTTIKTRQALQIACRVLYTRLSMVPAQSVPSVVSVKMVTIGQDQRQNKSVLPVLLGHTRNGGLT